MTHYKHHQAMCQYIGVLLKFGKQMLECKDGEGPIQRYALKSIRRTPQTVMQNSTSQILYSSLECILKQFLVVKEFARGQRVVPWPISFLHACCVWYEDIYFSLPHVHFHVIILNSRLLDARGIKYFHEY